MSPTISPVFNETAINNQTETKSILAFLPMAIISCVAIGVPLNLLIAAVIMAQRRLHKPRNIFWLGVTFSNLFALVLSFDELLVFYNNIINKYYCYAFIVPDSYPACMIFVLLVGIPYATLLLNLLLGLIDRFIAITYPLWHKNKVTIRRIVTAQLIGTLFISILFKLPEFLDGSLANINCQHHQPHGKIIVLTLMTLTVCCIVAQVAIYLKTKSYFIDQRVGQCNSLPSPSENFSMSVSRLNQPNGSSTGSRHEPEFFVHVGSKTISKLEVEAAWTLTQGVTSLVVISSPIFIVSMGVLYCNKVYDDCTAVTWMIPYFRELVVAHTIYNPIVYIWRSHEFSAAVRRKCCLN